MKILVTERDRYQVQKLCWDTVRYLPIPRKDRKLLAVELELNYWQRWRAEHKEDE